LAAAEQPHREEEQRSEEPERGGKLKVPEREQSSE
jgi:hypothetical protein